MYSTLLYSILFYSILFYAIPFNSIQLRLLLLLFSLLFHSFPFHPILIANIIQSNLLYSNLILLYIIQSYLILSSPPLLSIHVCIPVQTKDIRIAWNGGRILTSYRLPSEASWKELYRRIVGSTDFDHVGSVRFSGAKKGFVISISLLWMVAKSCTSWKLW